MRNIIKLILVGLLFYSCTSKEGVLKDRVDFLIENINESELANLYGFSANSRGKDDKGDRYLREIIYVNKDKERFTIPSFQTLGNKKVKPISSYDFISFGNEFEISENESILFAKEISKKMIGIISKYELYGIVSFLDDGELLGFEIVEGLLVYYVYDLERLNQKMKKVVEKGYQVKTNWYILNRTEESRQLIELYKRD